MCLRLYIAPTFGQRPLNRLAVSDVPAWVNQLRRTCQCCAQGKDAARPEHECCAIGQCCHQYPSDSTVHPAWRALRAALSAAVRDELLYLNVAALVRMPVPRSDRARIWTAEATQFLKSASADDDSLYAAYVLLLVLGLRRRGPRPRLAGRRPRQGPRSDRLAAPAPHRRASPFAHQDPHVRCRPCRCRTSA